MIESHNQYLDQFKLYLKGEGFDDGHLMEYADDINRFMSWVESQGIRDFEKLEIHILNGFRNNLRETMQLAPAQIERRVSKIKTYFRWLTNQELIKKNPFIGDVGFRQNMGSVEKKRRKKSLSLSGGVSASKPLMFGLGGVVVAAVLMVGFQPWNYVNQIVDDVSYEKDVVQMSVTPKKVVINSDSQEIPTVKSEDVKRINEIDEASNGDGELHQKDRGEYNFGYLLEEFANEGADPQSSVSDGDEAMAEVFVMDFAEEKSWWEKFWDGVLGRKEKGVYTKANEREDTNISPVSVPRPEKDGEYEVDDEELWAEENREYQKQVNEFLTASKESIEIVTNDDGVALGFIDTNSEYAVVIDPVVGMRLSLPGQIIEGEEFHETYVLTIGAEQDTDGQMVFGRGKAGVKRQSWFNSRMPEGVVVAVDDFEENYVDIVGEFLHSVVVVVFDDVNGNGIWDGDEEILPLSGLKVRLVKVG